MKWKSRRRDVPELLEPSLSDAALAEEEGLDRLKYIIATNKHCGTSLSILPCNQKFCFYGRVSSIHFPENSHIYQYFCMSSFDKCVARYLMEFQYSSVSLHKFFTKMKGPIRFALASFVTIILAVFPAFSSERHRFVPGHSISIVNISGSQLYSAKSLLPDGTVKKNIKPYLLKNITPKGLFSIVYEIEPSRYVVSRNGEKYLLVINEVSDPNSTFDYYDETETVAFLDSCKAKKFFCEYEWCEAIPIHSTPEYQILFQGRESTHRFILPYGLTCEEYFKCLYPIRNEAMLMEELSVRMPQSVVDSLSSIYVGKEIGLATSINNGLHLDCMNGAEEIFATPGISKSQLSQYSPVSVKDIRINKSMPVNARYYYYELYLTPSGGSSTILIPLCNDMSSILMTQDEYSKYLKMKIEADADAEAAAEAKRQAHIAGLIKQENENAQFERKLQDILVSMYGEQDGLDVWWGKVRFGFTTEMCQTAYRHCGPYKIAYNVYTPVGEATKYTWLEDSTSLYFIDDCLIGIEVVEKVRWK